MHNPGWSLCCTGLSDRQLIMRASDDIAANLGRLFRHGMKGVDDSVPSQPCASKKWSSEQLWRRFFSDSSQWWDHRFDKANARFPDFKHKKTPDALWINARSTPQWVHSELANAALIAAQQSAFSWNAKIAKCVEQGQFSEAVALFELMQKQDVQPDIYTFVQVFKACTCSMRLEEGKRIHCQAVQSGYGSDAFVGSCLVDMYAKCGSIEDAYKVFEILPNRDVVSWSAMIMGYAKCGQGSRALELYAQMQGELIKPNSYTFVGVLTACISIGALEEGRFLHSQVIEHEQDSDLHVGSRLVDMYAKSESLEDAFKVFNDMPMRDVVSWSAMIVGYMKCGQGGKALELFQQMLREGMEPNNVTFMGLIESCTQLLSLEEGRHVHAQVIRSGWETDISVENCLLDMYVKCESIEDACKLFNNMLRKNMVSWNTMIRGYISCKQNENAINLFHQMLCERFEPDNITFLGVLKACSTSRDLEQGKHIHEHVGRSKWKSDIFVGNSLIDMYAKCGTMEDARRVFDCMSTRDDIVCWSAMILGYVKCGQAEEALCLFREMLCKGLKPDDVTFVAVLNACASLGALDEGRLVHAQIIQSGHNISNAFLGGCVIDMYAKCRSMEEASEVFNNMQLREAGAWSAMIWGYVEAGQGETAISMFKQMLQQKVVPDSVTFVGALSACSSIAALNEGRLVHAQVIRSGFQSDVFVTSSLMDLYAKCGSIKHACRVFATTPVRDVVCWNAMLNGYAMHGLGRKAVQLLEWMFQENTEMDEASFVSLFSACSHVGLTDEGLYYFENMSPVYSLSAERVHYSSIVDLLGRAGHLHDAEDMIRNMPWLPHISMWLSLLGACKIHGNTQMGEFAAKNVFSLDPEHTSGYVLLSNIYAAAAIGEVDCLVKPRFRTNLMKKRHSLSAPG